MFHVRRKVTLFMIAGLILVIVVSSRSEGVTLAQSPTQAASVLTFNFKMADNNPILQPGSSGQWDAVSVRFPDVILYKGTYYLFYSTFQTPTTPVSIGYAQSNDGLHWTKFDGNPILKG